MLSTGKVHIFPGIPSRWSNGMPNPSIIDAQRAEADGWRTVPQRHHGRDALALASLPSRFHQVILISLH